MYSPMTKEGFSDIMPSVNTGKAQTNPGSVCKKEFFTKLFLNFIDSNFPFYSS